MLASTGTAPATCSSAPAIDGTISSTGNRANCEESVPASRSNSGTSRSRVCNDEEALTCITHLTSKGIIGRYQTIQRKNTPSAATNAAVSVASE